MTMWPKFVIVYLSDNRTVYPWKVVGSFASLDDAWDYLLKQEELESTDVDEDEFGRIYNVASLELIASIMEVKDRE